MISQQEIHKVDMSGLSVDPQAQLDLLLSDLLEQATLIAYSTNEVEKNQRIAGIHAYIRGYRDGFRMFRKDPYKFLYEGVK